GHAVLGGLSRHGRGARGSPVARGCLADWERGVLGLLGFTAAALLGGDQFLRAVALLLGQAGGCADQRRLGGRTRRRAALARRILTARLFVAAACQRGALASRLRGDRSRPAGERGRLAIRRRGRSGEEPSARANLCGSGLGDVARAQTRARSRRVPDARTAQRRPRTIRLATSVIKSAGKL